VSQVRLRQTDMQWRSVEGEIVALDLRASQYLGINASGSELWDMLVAGTTKEALADHLVQAHALDRDLAITHVEAFLDQLREQELLEDPG
jgi:hypothetical protein